MVHKYVASYREGNDALNISVRADNKALAKAKVQKIIKGLEFEWLQ